MKKLTTLEKTLLTIVAAVVFWALFGNHAQPVPAPSIIKPVATVEEMKSLYDGYNYEYFNDRLPKNVIIGLDEHYPTRMASTDKRPNGQFDLEFNPYYATADRWRRYLVLHESCHIETWSEGYPNGQLFPDETKFHAQRWRACMLRLDMQGAFREFLIDGYTEKMR